METEGRLTAVRRFALIVAMAAAWVVTTPAGHGAEPVPDFRLPDVNPSSVRYRAEVSPRDYLLQVSGYYFGDAG